MMNPEKLLGRMLKQGLKGGRRGVRGSGLTSLLGGGLTGVAGIGALGVAIAAFDHFMEKRQSGTAQASSVQQPDPPPPRVGNSPPPPPSGQASPPVAPPPQQSSGKVDARDAILLVRAMIAAANADGNIDQAEKEAVLGKLDEAGATLEEREFIIQELNSPPSIDSLVSHIDSDELKNQVYAVSLMAIEVDTKAERDYLKYLRARLGLDQALVDELHESLRIQA